MDSEDLEEDSHDVGDKARQEQTDTSTDNLDEGEHPLCEAWIEVVVHLSQLSFGTTRPSVSAKTADGANEILEPTDTGDTVTQQGDQSEETDEMSDLSGAAQTLHSDTVTQAPHSQAVAITALPAVVKTLPAALSSAHAVMKGAQLAAQGMLRDYTQLLDDLRALSKLSPTNETDGADDRVRQALRRHCEAERDALRRNLRAMHEAAAALTSDNWWGEAGRGPAELSAALTKHASSW